MSARHGSSRGWNVAARAPVRAFVPWSLCALIPLAWAPHASGWPAEHRQAVPSHASAAIFIAGLPAPLQPADAGSTSKAVLRGRGGVRGGEVTLASLSIESAIQSTGEPIGLHRIRDVSGPLAGDFDNLRATATTVWRATSRLERGDRVAAEPLLESLEATFRGRKGPTAAAVFEGLLRCRLTRSAQNAAVSSWLSWIRTGEIGQGRSIPQEIVDRYELQTDTLLVPALPPILIDSPALRASLNEWKPDEAVLLKLQSTGVSRTAEVPIQDRLAALYYLAAAFETTAATSSPTSSDHPPLRYEVGEPDDLALDVVAARIGTPEQRARARDRLALRLGSDRTHWVESWCRVAIGRSLLLEPDRAQRIKGILQLLTLASRGGDRDPYLTGLALAEACVALDREGDARGSRTLWAELRERFPGHPALSWAPLARAHTDEVPSDHPTPDPSPSGSVDASDATVPPPAGSTTNTQTPASDAPPPQSTHQNPDGENNP